MNFSTLFASAHARAQCARRSVYTLFEYSQNRAQHCEHASRVSVCLCWASSIMFELPSCRNHTAHCRRSIACPCSSVRLCAGPAISTRTHIHTHKHPHTHRDTRLDFICATVHTSLKVEIGWSPAESKVTRKTQTGKNGGMGLVSE